jgi:ferric-dicitrate binding protein FerR (iron transport regulator)
MKTKECLEKLLRQQSGELSPQELEALEHQIKTNPEWRDAEQQLTAIREAWHQIAGQTPAPSAHVMATIHARARTATQQHARGRLIPFSMPMVRVALIAALAVAAVGITLFISRPPAPTRRSEQAQLTPVAIEIGAALEAFDNSMLALLDGPSDESDLIDDNDS